MFGLPISTVVVIFGIPLLWVIYTLVFYAVSSRWGRDDAPETPAGAGPAPHAGDRGELGGQA